jgi:hypothetical protein
MPVPQVTRPAAQSVVQVPMEHTCPGAHARPQAPQLPLSTMGATQSSTPPSGAQAICPAGHTARQTPAMHCCALPQVVPQAPQWARAVMRLAQTPSHRVSSAAQGVTTSMAPRSVLASVEVAPTTAEPSQAARADSAATQSASARRAE